MAKWRFGGRVRCAAMLLVGRSDAAFGDQLAEGKCRFGHVIGLTSSSLTVPRHVLHWTSKFTRELVEGSLGGAVCALK